jgi:hypothetical protein
VSITQEFAIVNPRKAVLVGAAAGELAFPTVTGEKGQRLVSRIRTGKRQAWREQKKPK